MPIPNEATTSGVTRGLGLAWGVGVVLLLVGSQLHRLRVGSTLNVFSEDKVTMAWAMVDHFTGAPPRHLAWPGAMHQLPGTVAVALAWGAVLLAPVPTRPRCS